MNNTLITAHLNLYAVLPALKESSGTKNGIGLSVLPIGFIIPEISHKPISLVHILEGRDNEENIRLVLAFENADCFNLFMDGRGLPFSVVEGWYRIDLLIRFLIMMLRMKKLLRPSPHLLSNASFKHRHVQALLMLGLRASRELATLEPKSQWALHTGAQGMVEFCIEGADICAWCTVSRISLEHGSGHAPGVANVIITFKDVDAILTLLRNEIDFLSATGLTWIKVRGFVPLADTIGFVMDRVHRYLTP